MENQVYSGERDGGLQGRERALSTDELRGQFSYAVEWEFARNPTTASCVATIPNDWETATEWKACRNSRCPICHYFTTPKRIMRGSLLPSNRNRRDRTLPASAICATDSAGDGAG